MLEGLIGGRVQTGADGTFQLDGIAPDEAVTTAGRVRRPGIECRYGGQSLPERFRREITLRVQVDFRIRRLTGHPPPVGRRLETRPCAETTEPVRPSKRLRYA